MVTTGTFPSVVEDALLVFKNHEAVLEITEVECREGGDFFIRAKFDVNLPSRWATAGASPDGVLPYEVVEAYFPVGYPTHAPLFSLRPDFNPKLPHINPHSPGARIPPCILAGSNNELLHSEGLYGLVNQMAEWLKNAGRRSLINLGQGWEPMRRDGVLSHLFMDPEALLSNPMRFGQRQLFRTTCWWSEKTGHAVALRYERWPDSVIQPAHLSKMCSEMRIFDGIIEGQTLLVVCWPNATSTGQPLVDDGYLPDNVTTVSELALRAENLGCKSAFDSFAANLNYATRSFPHGWKLPIFVIFPVRRPAKVIGFTSEYEFLAYKVEVTTPAMLATKESPVSPVAFLMPTNETLLRRTSGFSSEAKCLSVAYLGCGSVGSKLALHSTRSGFPPGILIDREFLAPHNVARHALFPKHCSQYSKAAALADEVFSFGSKKPAVIEEDILKADINKDPLKSALLGDEWLLVNTTGSHAVRHFLANSELQARVIEGCITARGKAGILSFEGEKRNPNCADLMATAYEVLRQNDCLMPPMDPADTLLQVGVGCNSVTLPMSDTRISLLAAGMSQAILNAQVQGVSAQGLMSVGLVCDDGMSVMWERVAAGKTHLADVSGLPGWSVRVLDRAHQKITDDVARCADVETGGVIVGRCSPTHREVTIVDVLAAPPDSIRESSRFVLGVDGLVEAVTDYDRTGANVLWCLGTWHSHLYPSGPSNTDNATAKSIEGLLRGAVVMLIRHPQGYAAIVSAGRVQ